MVHGSPRKFSVTGNGIRVFLLLTNCGKDEKACPSKIHDFATNTATRWRRDVPSTRAFRSLWHSSCLCTLQRFAELSVVVACGNIGSTMKSAVSRHWRRLCKSSFALWWASQCLGCYILNLYLGTWYVSNIFLLWSTWSTGGASVQTSEVMRTPLQILFLILVTDLPPSIALGMEPGDFRQPLRRTDLAGFHGVVRTHICAVIYCPPLETLFQLILSESSNQQPTRWGPHFEDAPTTQGLHLESEAVAGTGLNRIEDDWSNKVIEHIRIHFCAESNQLTRDDARIRKGSCQLGCAWHCAALHIQEEPIVLMWSPAFKVVFAHISNAYTSVCMQKLFSWVVPGSKEV